MHLFAKIIHLKLAAQITLWNSGDW